jgi:B-cell receptor-associated protein 31
MGHERMEVQARKFYSQRNMYLCGFTIFLSLILNQTYVTILNVLRLEEKVRMYEGDFKGSSKDTAKLDRAGGPGEIGTLKNDLNRKDKELQAMKSQSEGLRKEFDELTVKYNQMIPDDTPKKDR